MTVRRQAIGRTAEELVAGRLRDAGWEIVERNARTRHGELDIVAFDDSTLVFVEVKAGREGSTFGPERPALAVDRRKQRRIRRLATAWMAEHRDLPHYSGIHFDVVGLTIHANEVLTGVEHIRGAF